MSTSRKPRVLVTGGLGFIGGHLVQALVCSGLADVRVFDNLSRVVWNGQARSTHIFDLLIGDIRNREKLHTAMRDCELVFHLAAKSNVLGAVSDPDYALTTNIGGTVNVLLAARELGVRRVIFTSSREVYGDPERLPVSESAPLLPKNAYGASKAAAEMYCRALSAGGPEIALLRLANVYGPYDRGRVVPLFVTAALRGERLTIYGGDQIIDFVWIDTVISALLRSGFGRYVPEPVNIGSGIGTTVLDLANRVLDLTRSASACVRMPARDVDVGRFVADIRRAQQLLDIPITEDPLDHLPQLIAGVCSRP